jgi:hypothetical protein
MYELVLRTIFTAGIYMGKERVKGLQETGNEKGKGREWTEEGRRVEE